jgi:protein-L-isoaspartate(D-aspartate) O-methyltransferase
MSEREEWKKVRRHNSVNSKWQMADGKGQRPKNMNAIFIVILLCFLSVCFYGCVSEKLNESPQLQTQSPGQVEEEKFKQLRLRMVDQQIKARDIKNQAVLDAMSKVPRHRFVPASVIDAAYEDHPLPIGYEQTISQPYIVAYMTEAVEISSSEKALEIGTGSGYQAAILGELAKEVYTIEIIPELSRQAGKVLNELGYKNIQVKTGNGYLGWPEHAPFDGIVVTAAPDSVPQALVDQLAVNGKMVIPVGVKEQKMLIITKTQNGLIERRTIPVRFVPMTGKPNQ